jgi:hypothetical protein
MNIEIISIENNSKKYKAKQTAHNEDVELILFVAWVFPPAGFYNFIADLLSGSPLRPSFANLLALPSPLTSALRQYPRYAFTYIMRQSAFRLPATERQRRKN